MRPSTLIHLARSNTRADRNRMHLAVGALAVSGGLVMGALRVARLGGGEYPMDHYSDYVADGRLRLGLIAVVVLFALLIGGVGAQVLRIGTAARERRLAALTLAGASQRQVRQLAIADAGLAGFFAGLWTGPVYLFLALGFSGLPRQARILPPIELGDLFVWPLMVALTTAAGCALGGFLHRLPAPSSSAPHPPPKRDVTVVVVLVVAGLTTLQQFGFGSISAVGLGILLALLGTAGALARRAGHRLIQSGRPVNLLTGIRLVADSRPIGRMATLLFLCGILIGGLTNGAVTTTLDYHQYEWRFYVTGMLLAIFGVLLVVVAVQLAMIVTAADQLVEQRRQLACLTALGVGPDTLRAVIRRQLGYLASPALAIGLLIGSLGGLLRLSAGPPSPADIATLITAVALPPAGWVLGQLGAAAAGHLLRNHIRDAVDPGNLRAA